MNLNKLFAAAAADVIGGTALSGIAAADTQKADGTAGSDTVSITVRATKGEQNVTRTLDDGHLIKTWNFTDGTFWINAPWVDNRKCTVASAFGSGRPILVSHEDVDYKDWTLLYVWAVNGTSRAAATLDVTLTCPSSALIPAAQLAADSVSPTKPPRRR